MNTKSVDITYAKNNLERMISEVENLNLTYIITVNSIPKAVLTSIEGSVRMFSERNIALRVDDFNSNQEVS